jgi:hypothetical protein
MSAIETVNVLNPVVEQAAAPSPLPGLIADLRAKGEDLKRSHELTGRILGELQTLLNGVGAVVVGSSMEAVDAKTFIDRASRTLSPDPQAGQMDASLFQAINAVEAYRRTTTTGKA